MQSKYLQLRSEVQKAVHELQSSINALDHAELHRAPFFICFYSDETFSLCGSRSSVSGYGYGGCATYSNSKRTYFTLDVVALCMSGEALAQCFNTMSHSASNLIADPYIRAMLDSFTETSLDITEHDIQVMSNRHDAGEKTSSNYPVSMTLAGPNGLPSLRLYAEVVKLSQMYKALMILLDDNGPLLSQEPPVYTLSEHDMENALSQDDREQLQECLRYDASIRLLKRVSTFLRDYIQKLSSLKNIVHDGNS